MWPIVNGHAIFHALGVSLRAFPLSPMLLEFVDCSQPCIFSYFYSTVERVDTIARELDDRTKRKTLWVVDGDREKQILLARFAANHTPPHPCEFAFSFACMNRESMNSLCVRCD